MTFSGKNKEFLEWLDYAFSFESPYSSSLQGLIDIRDGARQCN